MNLSCSVLSKSISLTLSAAIFFSPLPALAEAEGQICADVIVYAKNPETGQWQTFATPCEVPAGWESTPVKPPEEICTAQIMYGKNPATGQWEQLPNPCEAPAGWETSPTLPTAPSQGQ